jgi:citrate synthase
VLETLGVDDPILAIAKKLEALALEDEYQINQAYIPM